jgi:hypothetical protein
MLGFATLFVTTMAAGVLCFNLARDHFKNYVQVALTRKGRARQGQINSSW